MPEVAVTGVGVLSSLGNGAGSFLEALRDGRSGCRPPRRVSASSGTHVAEVEGIQRERIVRSTVGRRIDRPSLLALGASLLALEDAGVGRDAASGDRVGLALASALGDLAETETFLERLLDRGTGNPLVFPNLVLNAPLGYVSIELAITGPSAMLNEQEASGEAAIQWGARLVASGAVDLCLAGGADELTGMLIRIHEETRTAAHGQPRPFDVHANGLAPGEGAAVLVLEPFPRARRRGARIYAHLVPDPGFAVPAPVHGWPADPGRVAEGLRERLYGIDAVIASACGIPAQDTLEAEALSLAGARIPVTAPRGAVGGFGTAGALAVAAAALAVAHGFLPPTVGCLRPCREDLDVVRHSARALPLRAVLVTGLSRGGIVRPVRVEAV